MSDKAKVIISISAIVGIVLIMALGLIFDTKNRKINNDTRVSEVTYKSDSLQQVCDSLEIVIDGMVEDIANAHSEYVYTVDSLTEEIDIMKIKLDRIKEYNRIAGQGNNIVFLRGWINRVLSE